MASITRFYIIEKHDENEQKIWQLKRAKQDDYYTFYTFRESLDKFRELGARESQDSRVWFHQNGAFRGSMGYDKVPYALELVEEDNIGSDEAIDYLLSKNLIETKASKEDEEDDEPDKKTLETAVPAEKAQPVQETYPTVTVQTNQKNSKWFWALIWFLIILIIICIIITAVGLYYLWSKN